MVTTLHDIRTALHACQAVRIRLRRLAICSAYDLDMNAILMSSPEPYLWVQTMIPGRCTKVNPIMQVEDLSPISHMVAQLPRLASGTNVLTSTND
jgi:hypothetical protein